MSRDEMEREVQLQNEGKGCAGRGGIMGEAVQQACK